MVAEEDDVYNITMGNPDLKALNAVSYDASLEYYPQVGAAFSAGAFHKSIDDPIYTYRQAPGLWKNYGELLFDRITGGS
ncbi:TonB-dependent receptor domain-containing protein [Sphingomonas sp. IC081]|uniref:TonB-dependent receptor domain-containing protein n=1 Tax=Sphingomonas sp. IC081 TaxID=304378 RepID=UPI0028AE5840|nr:TonB-dependent receptor [Sphingomonas sp. IC081]